MSGDRARLRLVVLAVLLVGATLRVAWNDVPQYSKADETVYRDYARFLASSGWAAYPGLVAYYIATPDAWLYPPPLRYGHFAITGAACAAVGHCEYRTLAWVSTLAGIAMILLAYAIGRGFFDEPTGLLAAALVVTSPLQLGLGRRALQDEVAALVALSAAAAVLWAREDSPAPSVTALRTIGAVALSAVALAVKESFILFYPGLVAAYAIGIRARGVRWRDLFLFVGPPIIYVAGFVVSSGSVSAFFTVAQILVTSIRSNPYVLQNEAGPLHRPLFDLFVLAPVVCLLATAAIALVVAHREDAEPGPRRFSTFLVVLLVAFALVSKNLRYVVAADTVIRILAAWALLTHLLPRRWVVLAAALVVLVNGLAEIAVFREVFITGEVYDPVSVNVLRALEAIPR